ncbi:MAG TPA: hypothetical protein PKW28_12005 [Turneriella sp.]|nr:hypothetical protein [Turneriella sp.]HNJ66611.1 hypothetical protein [Turneriella sp.]HNN01186.1 hypothetical protein [Turneriella sp.]
MKIVTMTCVLLMPAIFLPAVSWAQMKRLPKYTKSKKASQPNANVDPGKNLPGINSEGFRRPGDAAGSASSNDKYTPTLDPGVSAPVSGSSK